MCLHVSDKEEALTLTLQGAVARNTCIAVAGRGDSWPLGEWSWDM